MGQKAKRKNPSAPINPPQYLKQVNIFSKLKSSFHLPFGWKQSAKRKNADKGKIAFLYVSGADNASKKFVFPKVLIGIATGGMLCFLLALHFMNSNIATYENKVTEAEKKIAQYNELNETQREKIDSLNGSAEELTKQLEKNKSSLNMLKKALGKE